jgi:hypothetical protein
VNLTEPNQSVHIILEPGEIGIVVLQFRRAQVEVILDELDDQCRKLRRPPDHFVHLIFNEYGRSRRISDANISRSKEWEAELGADRVQATFTNDKKEVFVVIAEHNIVLLHETRVYSKKK